MPDEDQGGASLVELTGQIVSAYVSKNSVRLSDLGVLISEVSNSIRNLAQSKAPLPEKLEPPVPINRTVHKNYIISLEDGRKYKTLRRHLSTKGLTPDEYREKWGLPQTYPLVAKGYSEARSEMAKAAGLGKKAAKPKSRTKGNRNKGSAAKQS